MHAYRTVALAAAAGLFAVPAATLALPEVIYVIDSQSGGSPKADVPGLPGIRFTNIGRINRSPNGQRWIVLGVTSATPATQDQVLVRGSGIGGQTVAQEGVTTVGGVTSPAAAGTILFGANVIQARVNDAGTWAVGYRPAPASGAGSLPVAEDLVARDTGSGPVVVAKIDDPVPPLEPGKLNGGFTSVNLNNAGQVAFDALIYDSAETARALVAADLTQSPLQAGVSRPTGQAEGETSTIASFSNNTFVQDAAGTSYIVRATLAAPTPTTRDQVAVVNGAVVLQEGSMLAGVGVISSISDVWMEPDGTWFARGSAGTTDWVVRNGAPLAVEGQPITPGSSELWASFTDMRGNNAGGSLVLGTTNNTQATLNAVAVYHPAGGPAGVLLRESDAVDLDGDGAADGLYLGTFRDRHFLNDTHYYFAFGLKTDVSATSGGNSSLLRVALPTAPASCNVADIVSIGGFPPADGELTVDDYTSFINAFAGDDLLADIVSIGGFPPSDGELTVDDYTSFINAFAEGCG